MKIDNIINVTEKYGGAYVFPADNVVNDNDIQSGFVTINLIKGEIVFNYILSIIDYKITIINIEARTEDNILIINMRIQYQNDYGANVDLKKFIYGSFGFI